MAKDNITESEGKGAWVFVGAFCLLIAGLVFLVWWGDAERTFNREIKARYWKGDTTTPATLAVYGSYVNAIAESERLNERTSYWLGEEPTQNAHFFQAKLADALAIMVNKWDYWPAIFLYPKTVLRIDNPEEGPNYDHLFLALVKGILERSSVKDAENVYRLFEIVADKTAYQANMASSTQEALKKEIASWIVKQKNIEYTPAAYVAGRLYQCGSLVGKNSEKALSFYLTAMNTTPKSAGHISQLYGTYGMDKDAYTWAVVDSALLHDNACLRDADKVLGKQRLEAERMAATIIEKVQTKKFGEADEKYWRLRLQRGV